MEKTKIMTVLLFSRPDSQETQARTAVARTAGSLPPDTAAFPAANSGPSGTASYTGRCGAISGCHRPEHPAAAIPADPLLQSSAALQRRGKTGSAARGA